MFKIADARQDLPLWRDLPGSDGRPAFGASRVFTAPEVVHQLILSLSINYRLYPTISIGQALLPICQREIEMSPFFPVARSFEPEEARIGNFSRPGRAFAENLWSMKPLDIAIPGASAVILGLRLCIYKLGVFVLDLVEVVIVFVCFNALGFAEPGH